MRALLICPSSRPAVPHLAISGTLATAPILGDCLVCHWIEHLAALGAREIKVIAAGGADQVRTAAGDGARWGVRVEVIETRVEPTRQEAAEKYRPDGAQGWLSAPDDIISMSYLPGRPDLPLFESYAGWFEALIGWMPRALTPARVRVTQASPGIWINSRARISATAVLIAPCWVGDQASVAAGAIVGPGSILEDRSVVEDKASVTQSWVAPDTFVGPMTSVANSLAWGSTLIDWRTDSSLQVPDPFLLSSLAKQHQADLTDRFGRALHKAGASDPRTGITLPLREGIVRSSDR
jgi:hypothetical protein